MRGSGCLLKGLLSGSLQDLGPWSKAWHTQAGCAPRSQSSAFRFPTAPLTRGESPTLLMDTPDLFIIWPCPPFEASSLLPSTPHTASTLFVLGYFCVFLSGMQYTPFLLLKALPCPDTIGKNPCLLL